MLTLLTYKPFLGTIAASPFAIKADALLAMSGLAYERKYTMPMKQPMGKLPVLVDGEKIIADSALIQRHLETAHKIDFDGSLSDEQKAQATALRRLVEDHLYFLNGHYRWTGHPEIVKEAFFAEVPSLIRGFVFRKVDKGRAAVMYGQGLGRHSEAEMLNYTRDDVNAISGMLGDKAFMFGETPTSIDASVWGCVHGALHCELETPGKTAMAEHANLVAYEERFRERFYGDS